MIDYFPISATKACLVGTQKNRLKRGVITDISAKTYLKREVLLMLDRFSYFITKAYVVHRLDEIVLLSPHNICLENNGNFPLKIMHYLDLQYVFSYLEQSLPFCRLLITFANSLDPDQDQQNVGPDLDPNRLTL